MVCNRVETDILLIQYCRGLPSNLKSKAIYMLLLLIHVPYTVLGNRTK